MTPLLTEIDFVGQGDESDGVAQNTRNTSRRRFRRRFKTLSLWTIRGSQVGAGPNRRDQRAWSR